MPARKRPALLLFCALAAVLSCLGLAEPVQAHAGLARADPAPDSVLKQAPDRVTIWFTEPVEPGFSEIAVLNSQARQVDNGDTARFQNDPRAISVTLPRLPDGTYTVAWRNISAVDGHPQSGSFIFSIGAPSQVTPPPTRFQSGVPAPSISGSPAEPLLRWLSLLGILAIIGCLAFELFISGPVLAANGADAAWQRMGQQLDSRTFKLTWLAMGVFLLATVGELMVKTSYASAIPMSEVLGRPLLLVIAQTGWGHMWLWRISSFLGMVAVMAVASGDRNRFRAGELRSWQVFTLIFGTLTLLTISLASHGAAAAEVRAAAVFSDYLHLLAAGFWVGGIIYLALVIPPTMKAVRLVEGKVSTLRPSSAVFCPESHVTAMGRFSALATLSVGVLFITGLYISWAQVTVIPAMATPYGITLLAKLGLVMPLLVLAGVNFLWVRPRLARDGRALRLLHKTLVGQAALAILVLLSAGILASLEPARQVAARYGIGQPIPVTLKATTESTQITVQVEPNRVGRNRFVVSLEDRRGAPVSGAQVNLRLAHQEANLAANFSPSVPVGEGRYVLETGLSLAGRWQLEVLVRRSDAFDARASFQFQLLPANASGNAPVAPSSGTGKLLWGVEILLLGLLSGGVALYFAGRKARLFAVICAGAAVLAGVLVILV